MEHCDFAAIEALLRRHGFHFSKSMGQNFLIDASIPAAIAEASEAGEGNGVLEIGPGIGALSHELCRRAGRVVAVELDKALLPILDGDDGELRQLRARLRAISLKTDIPALVRREARGAHARFVCANLPYNITTPAITALLESRGALRASRCSCRRRSPSGSAPRRAPPPTARSRSICSTTPRRAALRGRARALSAAAEGDLRRPARRSA